jgi:phage baseplate assembly protein W
MAVNTVTTIPQTQTRPQTKFQFYKGFSSLSPDTHNYKLHDIALIKQDLINHFYVRQGERLMNPEYGCVIWNLLFEPLTPEVQNLILSNVNQIFNSEPRVQAGNIVITPYDTGLQIECVLTYVLYNVQEKLQLSFDQDNGLTSL